MADIGADRPKCAAASTVARGWVTFVPGEDRAAHWGWTRLLLGEGDDVVGTRFCCVDAQKAAEPAC